MISPPALKVGSRVGIVAPAKRVNQEEMHIALSILQDWGLEVVLGEHLFKVHNQFAGTDKERTEDLQNMLDRDDIEAIICARGGYGTIRIVDKLDFTGFVKHPKWVVGFSDITVLHCHINNLGIESVHGIMPLLFPKQTRQTIDSLRQVLFGDSITIEASPHPLNRFGESQGEVVGGNLSLFANTIGTISDIDTTGKILFLEDVNEYIYHLDRLLIHLLRADKLSSLAGLVIGQFSEVKDNAIGFGKSVNEIIAELAQEFDYPICYDFPIGHERHNMAIVCGKSAILEVKPDAARLIF